MNFNILWVNGIKYGNNHFNDKLVKKEEVEADRKELE